MLRDWINEHRDRYKLRLTDCEQDNDTWGHCPPVSVLELNIKHRIWLVTEERWQDTIQLELPL